MTCVYTGSCQLSVLGEGLVCLSNNEVILHIGSHVNYFICYNACSLVYLSVGSLDEAVLIDPCESSQIGDKSDIRTFRGLDRTHSSVVAVVNVTYLESGTVS